MKADPQADVRCPASVHSPNRNRKIAGLTNPGYRIGFWPAARCEVTDLASDYDLLDAWANGDLTAGRQLFDRHFTVLNRFLRTKVEDGLEDLMQQTWLGCVEARARFRRESSFRTFLLKVARFQLYAYYRDRTRRPAIDFGVTSIADLRKSPSQQLSRRQEERLLLEALRRVPLDYQIVLELRFWQELTGPEMAEVLEIPEQAVRSRLRRVSSKS